MIGHLSALPAAAHSTSIRMVAAETTRVVRSASETVTSGEDGSGDPELTVITEVL